MGWLYLATKWGQNLQTVSHGWWVTVLWSEDDYSGRKYSERIGVSRWGRWCRQGPERARIPRRLLTPFFVCSDIIWSAQGQHRLTCIIIHRPFPPISTDWIRHYPLTVFNTRHWPRDNCYTYNSGSRVPIKWRAEMTEEADCKHRMFFPSDSMVIFYCRR